jgi:hypothetical protein
MLMLWWLAGAALLVALAALWTARSTARKLALLTQAYWELRYEFTSLRGESEAGGSDTPVRLNQGGSAPGAPQTSFVSLASLKTDAGKAGQAGKAGNESE